MELSVDFYERAQTKLKNSSDGKFFKNNDARILPSFDRCEDDDEITTGKKLGEGAFCEVREVMAIALKRDENSLNEKEAKIENFIPQPRLLSTGNADETDESGFPVNMFQDKSQIRKYMSKNCLRDDGEGDQARYALKQLKPNESKKHVEQGLIDLSIEAQFLACLNHPNVIKMRGTAGNLLSPDFGLVLDRLYMTLEDKMDFWTEEKKEATTGPCMCLGIGAVDKLTSETLMFSAVTAAYDLSCAMRYIHSKNLVYRDIKPENAGFDVRGDIKIFDFGFCKELSNNLLDKPSGLYKLSKMTGSYPYMSPENFLGKPYGLSSDVFSFGVLLWEMLECKFAFYHLKIRDYKDMVVEKNFRPNVSRTLPAMIRTLIKETWDPDPIKRPNFERVALLLKNEYQELSMDDNMIDRSRKMMDKSLRSFRVHAKREG